METRVPPIVIPMWLTGFDKLMPEGRAFPYKYLPRIGNHFSITFGEPLAPDELAAALGLVGAAIQIETFPSHEEKKSIPETERFEGWKGEKGSLGLRKTAEWEVERRKNIDVAKIRTELTAIVQQRVEALGRSISGDLLGATSPRT